MAEEHKYFFNSMRLFKNDLRGRVEPRIIESCIQKNVSDIIY